MSIFGSNLKKLHASLILRTQLVGGSMKQGAALLHWMVRYFMLSYITVILTDGERISKLVPKAWGCYWLKLKVINLLLPMAALFLCQSAK